MRNLLIALIAATTLWSCSEEAENNSTQKGHASMQVVLVDNPADYDAVLVEVIGFEYKIDTSEWDDMDDEVDSLDDDSDDRIADDGDDDGNWVSVSIEPTVYDLLELNNGTNALLADFDIPVGEFEQVRVILGDDNSLVINEDTMALKTPSGQTSGIKLKVDGVVEEGKYYRLVLDFDAAKSVVNAGQGKKYLLKPVIYADLHEVALEEIYGSITGVVYPAPDSVASVAYLIQNEDTLSTYPEESGYFSFNNLLPGSFDLSIVPSDSSGLSPIGVDGIIVGEAAEVDLDTLAFE